MDKAKKINFLKVGYKSRIDKLQKQIEELTVKMEEIDVCPTPYFYDSLHPRKEKKNLEIKISKIREEIKTLKKEIEEMEKNK